ncbi:hypothetical protein SAMN04487866_101577 [Thermoactinomyces sp. DSM 45891]|uniref:hypothetical protein n=1 Tax=Thermoactinomyces sp. DSM 45891 TaxID=1761907 RepID=UPI0009134A40|nr:hypothetical protein [Thermoactinomyces sp. DSM 45891]SFX11386.1 hypothetical protein SAMN04487866_101577 [Thermoactinomyces sp. DSM 45891]
MQKKAIGFVLVLAGGLSLVIETRTATLNTLITWPFLLFLLGSILVFISFLQKQSQLTVIGGIIAAIGLSVWGFRYIPSWPRHWSILMLMIGVVVFLQYMQNKNNMTLIISLVLCLAGFFANPVVADISLFTPIAHTLNTYWPILIVGLGLTFIMKR